MCDIYRKIVKIVNLTMCIVVMCSSFVIKFSWAKSFGLPYDMQFNGSVIDTQPSWNWRIHSDANNRAKDWDANRKDAIEDLESGNFRFNYEEKNSQGMIAFVQGVMASTASEGGIELLPKVVIQNDMSGELVLNGNTEPQMINIPAKGEDSSGNVIDGLLSMTISSAFSARYKLRYDTQHIYSEAYEGSVGWAAASIINLYLPNGYEFNDKGEKMRTQTSRFSSDYSISSIIDGTSTPEDSYSIIGGFSSHLSDISTIWSNIPDSWEATLSVKVITP